MTTRIAALISKAPLNKVRGRPTNEVMEKRRREVERAMGVKRVRESRLTGLEEISDEEIARVKKNTQLRLKVDRDLKMELQGWFPRMREGAAAAVSPVKKKREISKRALEEGLKRHGLMESEVVKVTSSVNSCEELLKALEADNGV